MVNPQLGERKDQRSLTPTEWAAFIGAFNATSAPDAVWPTLQDFVALYRRALDPHDAEASTWGVFSPDRPGFPGVNFLAWHREFLEKFEERLMLADTSVRIPYWDWTVDRTIPPSLTDRADVGTTTGRELHRTELATNVEIPHIFAEADFGAFQSALVGPCGVAHTNIGGDMQSMYSPNDPLFYLHHANLDKIWAD